MDRKKLIQFSLVDSIYWGVIASFQGFVVPYLYASGVNNTLMSFTLAVFMITSFIGAFFWGNLCDRVHSNKRVFIPQFIGMVLLALGIYFLAKINYLFGTILMPIYGFFMTSLGSNLDAWMIKSFHRDANLYGQARAIGSSGFAIMMLICGFLIRLYGYISMILVFLTLSSLIVLLVSGLQEEKDQVDQHLSLQQEKGDLKQLLKARPYVFMIFILLFTGLCISPFNNLKIVFLENVGGDISMLGLDSFFGVMVQAVFIFYSGKFRYFSPYLRLVSMAVLVLFTMLLTVFAISPWMIIFGTVLNNASYGIMLPTVRQITEENIQGTIKNTAHSLCDAVFGSFAGVIALLYSGAMIDHFGPTSVVILGSVIMLIPVMLSVYALKKSID